MRQYVCFLFAKNFYYAEADMFCCFHSIHNYHNLDHKFVIKSTHFGHFLLLSVIQKVLKWKLEEWLLFALDYAKYVYRNAKIYNENKYYEWTRILNRNILTSWVHPFSLRWLSALKQLVLLQEPQTNYQNSNY